MHLQEIENKMASMDVKSKFTSKQGARITTIFENSYVLKKFSPNKNHKNEWVVEYDVINHLNKNNMLVPSCYGYRVDNSGAYLFKEYIPGKPLKNYTQETAQQLSLMFSKFHAVGVVTCDAHNDNVIQTFDGELIFIDFGKATIFKKKDLFFYFIVAREIFFIKTKVIKDKIIYKYFFESYMAMQPDKQRRILGAFFSGCNRILHLRENFRQKYKKSKLTTKDKAG